MKIAKKAVFIELRHPQNKEEAEQCGSTDFDNSHVAKVFINTRLHNRHLPDTFFHEMAHVFFAFHSPKGRVSPIREEWIARKIGKACAELVKI